MSTRTVLVRVAADTAGFTGPMRAATATADTFGAAATRSGAGVRTLAGEATRARTGLTAVGDGAGRARTGLNGVTDETGRVRTGLRGISGETSGVTTGLTRVGATGEKSMGGLRNAMSRVVSMAGELGLILAGGEIFRGLKEIVEQGNEYNDSLNKFQEVTRATGGQMRTAGAEAQALGADLKLPQASAAESADAMVELAKAGLSAQDAITATRGTIQLASAARTDVATAAKIEGDALDQFGLKASDATTVADTLANVANNTSGELTDLAYALKYVGPTAHSMGISIQDATTAIGLLGKSGIIGETAGTALRSALVNMSKPTAMMKKGLAELNIQAYDSQGNFKGLEYVVGKLSDAQKHLTTQQFTAAAAMAFGKPALSAMTALAHQGTANFDQMATAINRQGGAAALAAAESKGLGGAMRGLGKELSSTFLQLYLAVSPGLEKITRGLSSSIADGLPYMKRGIKTAEDLWDIYGPTVESKLSTAAHGIGAAAESMVKPAEDALTNLAGDVAPLVATVGTDVVRAFDNAEKAAKPVVSGIKDVARSVTSSGGALHTFEGRVSVGADGLQKAANAATSLTGVLGPIGSLVGGVARGFSALPGPIQLSVLGLLALRPFRSQIQGLQETVTGYGRSAAASFNGVRGAMQEQRILGEQAGVSLSHYGAALAAVESRSPGVQAMATAFRGATATLPEDASRVQRFSTTLRGVSDAGAAVSPRILAMTTAFHGVTATLPEDATRVQRFTTTLRGVSAAGAVGALSGLKAAGKGLLGVLGGPWGVAITGAFTLMDVFAQHQQAAKQAVEDFTSALQKDSGVLGQNTDALVAQKLQQAGALDTARKYGIAVQTVEQAALGNKTALGQVNAALQKNASATVVGSRAELEQGRSHKALNSDALSLLGTINSTSSAIGNATQAYKAETIATDAAATSTHNATNPAGELKRAIDTLASSAEDASTKADALHTALDLLSGGELDVQAAVAQMSQSIQNLNDSYKDGVTKSDGYGKSLLQVNGSLNVTSKNGLALFNQLQDLNSSTAGAAEATYDYARANGTSVPAALKQAESSMQTAYNAAVKAGKSFGLSAGQAQILAAQMGFIPANLAIVLTTPGLTNTQKDLLYVQGLADHLPQGASIKVSALTADAAKELEAVGVKIQTLPGGREMVITAPTAKAQAAIDQLVAKKIPDKTVHVDAATQTAIKQLQGVQSKVASTKGKTVTVSALTGTAIKALESVGFNVKKLSGKRLSITAPSGTATTQVATVQRAINGLHGKSVTNTVTTVYKATGSAQHAAGNPYFRAGGGLVGRYAGGGVPQWIPDGGAIAGPGSGTSDSIPAWVSNGEYVIRAASVARYGMGLLDRINAGRYASGGLVGHYADGGFTYTPGSNLGAGSAQDRYNTDLQKLSDAVEKLSEATTASAKASAHKAINSADATLGLKAGTTSQAFNLTSYEKELSAAAKANATWESQLASIGAKAGTDIEGILQDMGSDGTALVSALSKASSKAFNDIVANLRKLAPTAAATLADYTAQLNASNTASSTFQTNLLKLTSMGYGDLALQLAGQGDDTAQAVAAAAVSSTAAASKANTALKASSSILTGDDLTNALTLLSALKSNPGAGVSQILAATGLDFTTVSTLAPKIGKQIHGLGADTFVQQMATEGVSFFHGGIAPDGANVRFAERGTGGEAFIPLGVGNRSRSTGLLSSVAGMFGYQLTPVGAAPRASGAGDGGGDHRTINVTVNEAPRTSAAMAQDIARRMNLVG